MDQHQNIIGSMYHTCVGYILNKICSDDAGYWLPGMTSLPNALCGRPGHTDRHIMYTPSCVKTTLAPLTEKDTNVRMPIKTRPFSAGEIQ